MAADTYDFDASVFDLRLDALDTQWLDQPKLMRNAGKFLADNNLLLEKEKHKREVLEIELKRKKAEIELAVRKDPASYGISKVTEAVLPTVAITNDAYVALENEVFKADARIIEIKHLSDLLSYEVKALEHRKETLQNLVILHGRSYFAEPEVKIPPILKNR